MKADVVFDAAKDVKNKLKHGISLSEAGKVDISSALTLFDDREDYGEIRYTSVGFLGSELFVLVYTLRGDVLRAISLRKATKREQIKYAENS